MLTKNQKITHFLRPVSNGWQLWNLSLDGRPLLIKEASRIQEIKPSQNCIVGLPAKAVLNLSIWVLRTEPEYTPDLIRTQLEKRGLYSNLTEQTIYSSEVVASSESHDLHFVSVLVKNIPDEFAPEWCEHYDLAARYLPFASDGIYIWKELGSLVAAYVNQGKACHIQDFNHSFLDEEALSEIQNITLALEAYRIVKSCNRLRLWGDFSSEEALLVQHLYGSRFQAEPLPKPRITKILFDLTPPGVRQHKTTMTLRSRARRIILLSIALYLIVFSVIGLYLASLNIEKQRLIAEIEKLQPKFESISSARNRWLSLELILDPTSSFLETLYQLSLLIPEDGIIFTSFEMDPMTVSIQAEAANFTQAFKFAEDVKNNPHLNTFIWESPAPKVLPNNKTQFQLLGRSVYASSDIE